ACGGRPEGNTNTNANTTTSPTPTPDPCAAVTDDMIIFAINGQLSKDPEIFPQIKQINVWVKAGVVTLTGWVSDSDRYAKVVGIAENTTCVKKPVNVDNFFDHSGNITQTMP